MNDRERILSPYDWPHWPLLPMKRHGSQTLEVGIIVGDPLEGHVAFIEGVNMFDRGSLQRKPIRIAIDDLLAQGWEVD